MLKLIKNEEKITIQLDKCHACTLNDWHALSLALADVLVEQYDDLDYEDIIDQMIESLLPEIEEDFD